MSFLYQKNPEQGQKHLKLAKEIDAIQCLFFIQIFN